MIDNATEDQLILMAPHAFLLTLLLVAGVLSTNAQSNQDLPSVCEISEIPRQLRFYQRGNARDYAEEAESCQFIRDYLIPALHGN